MAKQQSFSDKAKAKKKSNMISVKLVKTFKSAEGNYKFQEKFVQVEDINKVSSAK